MITKWIVLFLAFTASVQAQQVFRIQPLVSTKVEDSISVTSGSKLILANRINLFDTANVKVGVRVQGTGIPYGATVATIQGTGDSLTISSAATVTTALATLSFGYFVGSQAYQAADALGWMFRMPDFKKIFNVIIVDDVTQLATSATLAVFDTLITPTADNAAFAPTDAGAHHLVALELLNVSNAWGANKVWSLPATNVVLPVRTQGSYLYGQLIAGGVGTYTGLNNLTVIIIGE